MAADNLRILEESIRRRTIAVISHPDAGKSTLTEALLLHADVIDHAGAVHGKPGRPATVTDWMTMEKAREISISSAAIQFEHRGTVINLVDTPGHADFSEDTFRVLSAVDAAIMLVDASKGLETQTMKLFDACRRWSVPIITMINKWDRPGRDALALIDEIERRTGLIPTPVNWPVGEAGRFLGLHAVDSDRMLQFHRTPGGARIATHETLSGGDAETFCGTDWRVSVEEVALLRADGRAHNPAKFRAGRTTPVLFGAAVQNIGVAQLLDVVVADAPAATARTDTAGRSRPVNGDFSGYVFKVQSGMNPAHRDRLAFIRVCSGMFVRGTVIQHAQTGRPFATKYAQQLLGQQRHTIDTAWPGDIFGLVNASNLRPGDTVFTGEPVRYPALPKFAPEHFQLARSADSSKTKQFRRGIEELDQEGVIQALRTSRYGDQAPILGAVGPMQFEVVEDRMKNDYGAAISLEPLKYTVARATTRESAAALEYVPDCEITRRSDGAIVALFTNEWRVNAIKRDRPTLVIDPLAGTDTPTLTLDRA